MFYIILPLGSTSNFHFIMASSTPLNESSAQEYNKHCVSLMDQTPADLSILKLLTLPECKKILDIGCGTGNYTFMLAEWAGSKCQVVGVDPDKERIKIAKESNTNSNVLFEVGDGQCFPEDQYDLVFSHYVLHLIEDKHNVFERVSKNIRVGGQFVIIVEQNLSELKEEMTQMMGIEKCKAIKNKRFYCTPEKYFELACANGFILTFNKELDNGYNLPNIDSAFSSWYANTFGVFNPSEISLTSLEEFRQKYAQSPMYMELPTAQFIFTKK